MASVGGDGEGSLNINLTPMIDIFSIMVTFLLMSYSTDPVNHDIDQNLELPQSKTIVSLDEIPAVVINRNEIIINDKKIVNIINGDVPEKEVKQGAIFSVFQELEKLAKMNAKVIAQEGDEAKKKQGQLTLEMDKGHKFKLLKRVMLSGQQAEFFKFKLLVAKDDI